MNRAVVLAPLLLALVASPAGAFETDLVPLAGAPAPTSALAGEGFNFVGEVKGVKIYRREKRAGLEFAAEGTFPASPERVRKVLIDYPSHGKWQKHLKENRVLGRGDGFLDVYQRMGLPVIDDRDYTIHVTWGDDGGVLWTRFQTANEKGPAPVAGAVRMKDHSGSWRLEPEAGGKATHAIHRFHLDLAGSVPSWAAKGQAMNDIPEFFNGVGKQLPNYP